MRKKLVLVIAILALAFGLAACGGGGEDSPYAGTWKATTAEYAGIEMEIADILGSDFAIIVESNGKYSVDSEAESAKGKWEETENGIMLDGEMEMVIDGDTAVLDYSGVTMNLVRE